MSFSLTELSQVIVAIFSLIFYLKNKTKFAMILTFILFTTAIVEIIGAYFLSIKQPNLIFYQISHLISFGVIPIMYYNLIKDKIWIRSLIVILSAFLVLWIITFFNKNYFQYYVSLGYLSIGLTAFFYLKELLLSDKILNYKKLLPFWVSIGFLIFYLPSIPFFTMINYMKSRGLFPIVDFLVILMNLIISFGLIWSSKEAKY